ncbi:hypothetical protein [Streptomyces sp. NPDC020983]|uniref:hypothetical protein n=1 Tax=Streptomyces sp. NPDC020983 TaxID=3365106 RepID=UPI00379E44F9
MREQDQQQAGRTLAGLGFVLRTCSHSKAGRTRQQYLDDEWDGISESAAYLEIREWPLAKAIGDVCERPAPDSHVRALVDVADEQGQQAVAHWYEQLRVHGQRHGHRVTADVVANLADFLRTGTEPERLDALFTPRQLPKARKPSRRTGAQALPGQPVTGTVLPRAGAEGGPGSAPTSQNGAFQNLGTGAADPGPAAGRWLLSAEHVDRLSSWIAAGAEQAGLPPEHAADLLVQALTADPIQHWVSAHAGT